MLTLITGTPGAGKSLYSTWEFARKVPGSFLSTTQKVESHGVQYEAGDQVPRRLFSNIKGLLIDHQPIDADNLQNWHTWAQPGDVILFDEVQEVWRPRSLGKDVPPAIAALETHRHMGVDIILVTQNPMLMDTNIRRLVNQHFHLRRLSKGTAYVYEWDHCAIQTGTVTTALQAKLWFHPKKAYDLYKSASLHTKPTAKIPRLAIVGVLAVAGMAVAGPYALSRVQERFAPPVAKAPAAAPSANLAPFHGQPSPRAPEGAGLPAPGAPAVYQASFTPPADKPLGCISMKGRCECFGQDGSRMQVPPAICDEGSHRHSYVIPSRETVAASSVVSRVLAPVPPATSESKNGSEAAAAPNPVTPSPTGGKQAGTSVGRVS